MQEITSVPPLDLKRQYQPLAKEIASTFFNFDIAIPEPGEYVALGAAKQAAWALSGKEGAPNWVASNVEHLTKSGSSHHLYEEYKLLIQGNSN